jgi:hypothetical protein
MACRRRARADRERGSYHERKAVTSQVAARTLTELRAQVAQDEFRGRPPQWPLVQTRIDGLLDAHEALLDGETEAA